MYIDAFTGPPQSLADPVLSTWHPQTWVKLRTDSLAPKYRLRPNILRHIETTLRAYRSVYDQVIDAIRRSCIQHEDATTVDQLVSNLKEVGFEEQVIDVIYNRWQLIDRRIGGLPVILDTSLFGWAIHFIRTATNNQKTQGKSSSAQQPPPSSDNQSKEDNKVGSTPQDKQTDHHRESHSSSSKSSHAVVTPPPRLGPRLGLPWRAKVHERVIYGNKDLRGIPAISDYIDPSKCLDEVALYDSLAGVEERSPQALYHQDPYAKWGTRRQQDSPYYGARNDGTLPPESQYYYNGTSGKQLRASNQIPSYGNYPAPLQRMDHPPYVHYGGNTAGRYSQCCCSAGLSGVHHPSCPAYVPGGYLPPSFRGGKRFVFHGTTAAVWEGEYKGGDSWQDGFSSEQSCETVSQSSRRRAVYFSNSLAHAFFYGSFRFGVGAVEGEFDAIKTTAIVVEVDISSIVALREYGSLCIFDTSQSTQDFIEANKADVGPSSRITPSFTSAYRPCMCPPLGVACTYCQYSFIYGPFRRSNFQRLQRLRNKEMFGGFPVDQIRQLCAGSYEAVNLINTFKAEAIKLEMPL
jgi:hypothetical protein